MEDKQDELRAFVAKVETALTPGLTEMLSDETHKVQRALLALSVAVLLVTVDAIRFSGNFDFMGVRFAGSATKFGVVLLGIVVTGYLEVLFAIRCYSDWHLWRLRNRKGELDAKDIERDLTNLRDSVHHDLMTASTGEHSDVSMMSRSADHVRVPISITVRTSPVRRLLTLLRRDLIRSAHNRDGAVEMIVPRATADRIERMKQFGPQYMWFYDNYQAYERSRRARILIEVYFPLLLGALTLAYGFFIVLQAI